MSQRDGYFTLPYYIRLLQQALALGYKFQTFSEYLEKPKDQVILLRHDVDVSLEYALELGRHEERLGILSSFFVRVRSSLYNVHEAINTERLEELAAMGFEIGLQEEAGRFAADYAEIIKLIKEDKESLEKILGKPIYGVTTHLPKWNPFKISPDDLDRTGFRYDPGGEIFNQNAIFVSDSNKCWKKYSLEETLGRFDKVLASLHPVWWVGKIKDPANLIKLLAEGK